jgi:GcrA cell cycle regulator
MSVWETPGLVELLISEWKSGKSASQVANIANLKFGIALTRNAVISRLHRMRINSEGRVPRRAKTSIPTRRYSQAATPSPSSPSSPSYRAAPRSAPIPVEPYVDRSGRDFDPAKLVTFDQLEDRHCRWPVGMPGTETFRFCGEARVIGLSYCEDCAKISRAPMDRPGMPVDRPRFAQDGQNEKLRPDVAKDEEGAQRPSERELERTE